jgi:hypothetical protein
MADLPIRPLDDFSSLVMPYCAGVPHPMMEQALRLSAAEFCERTRCWRYLTTRTISREESTIVAPSYATIFEIESATFDGLRLEPTQYTQLDQGLDPLADNTGQPYYISQKNLNSVVLIPPPADPATLVLSLFLKPKVMNDLPVASAYAPNTDDDYNVVPEFMLVQYGEAIAAGALTRLLSIPGQSFTDPNRASGFFAIFERACDNNFRSNLRGQQRAPSRSRGQYF